MFRVLRITVVDEGEPDKTIRERAVFPDDDLDEYPDYNTFFEVLKDGWEPFAVYHVPLTTSYVSFLEMWFKREVVDGQD